MLCSPKIVPGQRKISRQYPILIISRCRTGLSTGSASFFLTVFNLLAIQHRASAAHSAHCAGTAFAHPTRTEA